MRHRLLILIATLSLACHRPTPTPTPAPIPVPVPVPTPTPEPTPQPEPDDTAPRLLDAHNVFRASKGLKPLAANPKLQAAAQAHSDFMAKVGRMAHDRIGDGSPWDRIAAAGYPMSSGAENVAAGQRDVAEVMAAWKGSIGHRANMLGRCSEFGGAVAHGNGAAYWTTVFASPANGVTAAGEPTITIHVDQDANGNGISAARYETEGSRR